MRAAYVHIEDSGVEDDSNSYVSSLTSSFDICDVTVSS